MEQEQQQKNHDILESLRGTNYVVAETFLIQNGSSGETLREKARNFLSSQGITDPVAVTFCNSEKERIIEIINSLKNKKTLSASKDPRMGIVGFNANQLQKMFEDISVMFIDKDPILEDIDAKNTVIFLLNAEYPTKQPFVDHRTGLSLVAVKKGEQPAFPMDPILPLN